MPSIFRWFLGAELRSRGNFCTLSIPTVPSAVSPRWSLLSTSSVCDHQTCHMGVLTHGLRNACCTQLLFGKVCLQSILNGHARLYRHFGWRTALQNLSQRCLIRGVSLVSSRLQLCLCQWLNIAKFKKLFQFLNWQSFALNSHYAYLSQKNLDRNTEEERKSLIILLHNHPPQKGQLTF